MVKFCTLLWWLCAWRHEGGALDFRDFEQEKPVRRIVTAVICLSLLGCGDSTSTDPDDSQGVTPTTDADVTPESDVTGGVSGVPSDVADGNADDVDASEEELAPTGTQPVAHPEAAARAFQLYYKERVERAVIAHQRYGVFGDVTFGTAIDRAYVAIDGDEVEIIGGPKDNNLIGTAAWTTWEAYQIFGGRLLELASSARTASEPPGAHMSVSTSDLSIQPLETALSVA